MSPTRVRSEDADSKLDRVYAVVWVLTYVRHRSWGLVAESLKPLVEQEGPGFSGGMPLVLMRGVCIELILWLGI